LYDAILDHFLKVDNKLFKRETLYSAYQKMAKDQKKIIPIIGCLQKISNKS
jgi:hypothetical protein